MSARKVYFQYIILVIIIGLLFAPVPVDNLWWREAFNSGHTILFIVLFFFVYSQLKLKTYNLNLVITYLSVLFVGLLSGVVLEMLQVLVQREASLNDLYRNSLGLMIGLCFHAAYSIKNSHQQKTIAALLIFCGVSFLLVSMKPLMTLSWHYLERSKAFPVILDFDSKWGSSFIRRYNEGGYLGVSVIEPEPDWSAHRQLRFSVRSLSDGDINLGLRIHDKTHNQNHSDRFNMKLLIRPGLNEFQIPLSTLRHSPLNRKLDLKNIASISVFSKKMDEWTQVEVGNISLE